MSDPGSKYDFNTEHYRQLECPVLLQIGSASPCDLYVTDALTNVLPHSRVEELPGQAHEGMTTAPQMYAHAVTRFLLGSLATRQTQVAPPRDLGPAARISEVRSS
jgi:hypothetical protein